MADNFPSHAIAIVGMAGRFPGAADLNAFWRNLRDGVESIEAFNDEDLQAAGVPPAFRGNPRWVRKGTALEGAESFDAAFFGISPREAQVLDPQHRVFLECAWEALENAGYGTPGPDVSVGVYGGAGFNTYLLTQLAQDPALLEAAGAYQLMLGNDKDFICTRASYKLDLKGPSVSVQTACSTSLVAVVLASRALARGECDMALAGGVSIAFPQRSGYLFQEGMILSPDGRCRPFDAQANGTRPSSGCGIVVLKRLEDALAGGDTIRAIIRGAALNNDGAAKAGYTAPSVTGQVEAIATALELAGVDPRSVHYIETHGTGTALGDPIEIAALTQVFRAYTPDVGFCRIGSLKANLGHLDAAAGVASLIKATLVLENQQVPPLVNFTTPNPQLSLSTSPFTVPVTPVAWDDAGGPRRAGVSSFGIGGTNAHVVLEEAPVRPRQPRARAAFLLVLSAKTEDALSRMARHLATHLSSDPKLDLADVEYTLQVGRRTFEHRRVVVAADLAHALKQLSTVKADHALTAVYDGGARKVSFLFSGQGSQFVRMGAGLYASEPVYRDVIDQCAAGLQPHLGIDIRTVIDGVGADAAINDTGFAQPALFAMELALATLWASWGVQPSAMLGHSIGEYVAAHLAGVLSLADALTVVAARGRLMQSLPGGSMAAVHLTAAALSERLLPGVEIAAINAPGLCVISGPRSAMEVQLVALGNAGIETRELRTSHAFHSSMMEPALAGFAAVMESVTLNPPRIPYVSNVTGTWITPAQATSPGYYVDHLRRPVLFEDGVRTLTSGTSTVLLEVGPGNALTTLARLTLARDGIQRAVSSLGRAQDTEIDAIRLRESAGRMWLQGVPLDFAGMHAGSTPRRVPLPTYPFERVPHHPVRRGFVAPAASAPVADAVPTVARSENRCYSHTWMLDDVSVDDSASLSGTWLILGSRTALTDQVAERFRLAGAAPLVVLRGERLTRITEATYEVGPHVGDDLPALIADLSALASEQQVRSAVAGIVHLWAIDDMPLSPDGTYDSLIAIGTRLDSLAYATGLKVVHASVRLHRVFDEAAADMRQALALGPAMVLPTEVPGLRMTAVDLDAIDTPQSIDRAARALVEEAASADGATVTAWRHERRWIRRLDRILLPEADARRLPLKPGGVYLITGGTGGIGLTLARWLAEHYQSRLLLTSRTPLPPRTEWNDLVASRAPSDRIATVVKAVLDIERVGGSVIVAAANAASNDAMAVAIDKAQTRWGAIDGVIHAAGISGTGRLAVLKEADEARAVIEPKVDGLTVLLNLLGTTPLDFVALMSSVNSVLGSPGTCDYAAANAVLDAFAESPQRPAAWKRVVAFNWGAWREVGMAAGLKVPDAHRDQWNAFLATAIEPAAGAAIFVQGLASRRSRVVVTSYDLIAQESAIVAATGQADGSVARGTTGGTSNAIQAAMRAEDYNDTALPMQRRVAAIWGELLGIERIADDENFFELGGHSLLATRVLARVHEVLKVRLTLRDVFEASTVQLFTARIESAMATGGPATSEATVEEREEIEF